VSAGESQRDKEIEQEKPEIRKIRETLKPNLSGYSEKSLLRRVPLPTPEGPQTTRGRGLLELSGERREERGERREERKVEE